MPSFDIEFYDFAIFGQKSIRVSSPALRLKFTKFRDDFHPSTSPRGQLETIPPITRSSRQIEVYLDRKTHRAVSGSMNDFTKSPALTHEFVQRPNEGAIE